MKKTALLILPALVMIFLTGCGERNEVSSSKAGDYLSKLYDRKFSYIDTKTIKRDDGRNDICYNFEDEDGIACHVFCTADGDGKDWKYHITEDYQVMYLNSHPEIYKNLVSGDYVVNPVWTIGDDMINSVRFTVYYSDYNDIESAVRFAENAISGTESIISQKIGEIRNPPDIYSEGAAVGFSCEYIPTNLDVVMYFPLGDTYVLSGDNLISRLQNHYNSLDPNDIIYQPPTDFSSVPEGEEIPTTEEYYDNSDYSNDYEEYYGYEEEYYDEWEDYEEDYYDYGYDYDYDYDYGYDYGYDYYY